MTGEVIVWAAFVAVLQAAVLFAAACLAVRLLHSSAVEARLTYWRIVLALVCMLPFAAAIAPAPAIVDPLITFRFRALAAASDAVTIQPSWGRLIILLFATGAAFRIARLIAGIIQLRRIRSRAIPYHEGCALHGASLTVLLSDAVETPASYGFRQPVILLPRRWLELDCATREAAITHEVIHIERNDWLFHLVEEALLAALWFHPVLPAIVRRIRLVREQVVDFLTVRRTQAPKDYMQALVALANPRPHQPIPAPSFSSKRQLRARIESLKKENPMSRIKTKIALVSGSAFLVIMAVLAVEVIPVRSATAASTATPSNNRVYKVGGDVQAPKVLTKIDPHYTPTAKQAKVEGNVVLSVIVGKDGVPRNVQVLHGIDPGLDRNAVESVEHWRFQPGLRNGKPVDVRATIEVNFRLI